MDPTLFPFFQCALLYPINFCKVWTAPSREENKRHINNERKKNRYYSLKRMMMERFLGMNKSSSFKSHPCRFRNALSVGEGRNNNKKRSSSLCYKQYVPDRIISFLLRHVTRLQKQLWLYRSNSTTSGINVTAMADAGSVTKAKGLWKM